MLVLSVFIVITSLLINHAHGYRTGAPSTACSDLQPQHPGKNTATGPPPFELIISKTSYVPGQQLQVTLQGTHETRFKGFLLIGKRTSGSTIDSIGSFQAPLPNGTQLICSSTLQPGNGVTHTNPNLKSSLTFNWTAPALSEGDIVFHYTVVRDSMLDYFKDLRSAVIAGPRLGKGQFEKDRECGKSKGCYSDCIGGICEWEATWKNAGDKFDITLKSAFEGDNKWVALGFSDSAGMAKASVVACVAHGGKVEVLSSFNPGFYNQPLTNVTEGISNQNNSYSDGILQCSFSRETTSTNPQIYNLTDPWYIITARGDAKADGTLDQHDSNSAFNTDSQIDLSNGTTDASFARATTTPVPQTTPKPASKFMKDPECGKTKGCYSDCDNDECDLLLAWAYKNDHFEITLKSAFSGTGNHYLAMGLASSEGMSPASVVACTVYNGNVDYAASYNSGFSNSPLANPKAGLSNAKKSYANGVLECTFNRETKSANNSKIFDMSKYFYLITARGESGGDGILTPHDGANRFVTSKRIDFKENTDISVEATKYPLMKAHACLMVLAWMLSASLGIGLARFFKKQWPDTKWFDLKVWFVIHRSCMVLAFLMGISAFILIFVEVKGYSEIIGEDYKKAHPILGIVTTALLFINPFMSMLRCGPEDPRRPIFNWAHFLVGQSAHILSGITITLGLYLPKAQVDKDLGLIIMIIYGSWHLVFFVGMSIIDHMSNNPQSKTSAKNVPQIEMTRLPPETKGSSSKGYGLNSSIDGVGNSTSKLVNSSGEPPKSTAKKVFLFIHVAILAALTIFLLYLIIDGNV